MKFSIAITRVFCIMHNKIRNIRERVRRVCAWPKVCDVKILIAITSIFHIVNVQILKTRKRESTESMEWPRVSSEKISIIIIRVF